MPKYNLYPTPNPDGTNADRRIEVGWQRERGVQVGVTVQTNPANLSVEQPAGEPSWDGQHVELDRSQINSLIRTLREARDAAYGRDE